MIRWVGVLVVAVVAACNTPPVAVRFTLTDGDSQQCIATNSGNATTDCADMTMMCPAVLGIRIVPPNAPDVPYAYKCELLNTAPRTLCEIAGVDLPRPTGPVEEQILEIQMAVFPADALTEPRWKDAGGNFICPAVEFAANGLPVQLACPDPAECPPQPAVAGRTYYYPGDKETVVELGCVDFTLLTKCEAARTLEVLATVNDFGDGVPVGPIDANRLSVSIGEPALVDAEANIYRLTQAETTLLDRASPTTATWRKTLVESENPLPKTSYCIEVSEDVFQATRTVSCHRMPQEVPERIDALGVYLSKQDLNEILAALAAPNTPVFPDKGIVIGVVLNQFNLPVAGANVSCVVPQTNPPSTCTVKYLSADKQTFSRTGGTSANGIWVVEDAPYNTLFSWSGQVRESLGGLVEGKVTIVILQEATIGG